MVLGVWLSVRNVYHGVCGFDEHSNTLVVARNELKGWITSVVAVDIKDSPAAFTPSLGFQSFSICPVRLEVRNVDLSVSMISEPGFSDSESEGGVSRWVVQNVVDERNLGLLLGDESPDIKEM